MRPPWVFKFHPGGTGRAQTFVERSSCALHHPSSSRPNTDEINERILGLRPLSNDGRTSGPSVRPAIGGREGGSPSPVPSGRAPRFGRFAIEARAPRIRVSFGPRREREPNYAVVQATGAGGRAKKKPLRSSSLGRGPNRTDAPLAFTRALLREQRTCRCTADFRPALST